MIEFADATIGYPHAPVLEHVSLSVGPGECAVIYGENGTGKSTLLKTMLGIMEPLGGSVENAFAPSETGYLPQLNPLRFDFPATCEEIASSGLLAARRGEGSKARVRGRLCLERMGIADLERADFRRLSGGQRQRVLIARALASAKSLLVLDEPTNELDPQAVRKLFDLISWFRKEGTAIVMVSHDADALQVATRAFRVDGGRCKQERVKLP